MTTQISGLIPQPRSGPATLEHRHLLGVEHLSSEEIETILDLAAEYKRALVSRPDERLTTLRGRTVVNLFFENSTRTRTSFELAARRLGGDVINFDVATSSVAKGETLVDTAETIEALGADFIVMRHGASGSCNFLMRHVSASLINAGDGSHEHPTQALLDALTIREALGRIEGASISIIGDALHSRVARSAIWALTKLGARVTLAGPSTLVPIEFATLNVRVVHDFREAVQNADVIYLLRVQTERQAASFLPSLAEYRALFGMDGERLAQTKPDALIMHPGPVNRGVEVTREVMDSPRSRILGQVTNGVAVRMAVLTLLDQARLRREAASAARRAQK
ncbi:MAG: aspartate carbamoyltransferase catalytic subunit [Planctomycetota bacterium]|nr:aspartate carbamoyltransferase catalytic subunit [Planctomycetota bacterium]